MNMAEPLFYVNTKLDKHYLIEGIEDRLEKIRGIADCISAACTDAHPNNTGLEKSKFSYIGEEYGYGVINTRGN